MKHFSFLTLDQKRQIVIKHYEAAGYKDRQGKPIKVNPNLPEKVIEEYYANICKLRDSERRITESRPRLKLILSDSGPKVDIPDEIA